jgi:hypothetical protein
MIDEDRTVTRDESWCLMYDPAAKLQSAKIIDENNFYCTFYTKGAYNILLHIHFWHSGLVLSHLWNKCSFPREFQKHIKE